MTASLREKVDGQLSDAIENLALPPEKSKVAEKIIVAAARDEATTTAKTLQTKADRKSSAGRGRFGVNVKQYLELKDCCKKELFRFLIASFCHLNRDS